MPGPPPRAPRSPFRGGTAAKRPRSYRGCARGEVEEGHPPAALCASGGPVRAPSCPSDGPGRSVDPKARDSSSRGSWPGVPSPEGRHRGCSRPSETERTLPAGIHACPARWRDVPGSACPSFRVPPRVNLRPVCGPKCSSHVTCPGCALDLPGVLLNTAFRGLSPEVPIQRWPGRAPHYPKGQIVLRFERA